MIRNLLLAKLNPRYYSSVECCTYVDMLENIPEARKKYDLILCDERLSNDPLFLSYAEIRNDLNNINAYLQMLRDLFGNDLKKEDIRTQELKLSDGWAEELLAESRAFPVAAFTVEEIQKKTICVKHIQLISRCDFRQKAMYMIQSQTLIWLSIHAIKVCTIPSV